MTTSNERKYCRKAVMSKIGRRFESVLPRTAVTGFAALLLLMASVPQAQAGRSEHLGTPIKHPIFNCQATDASEDYVNFESGPVNPVALSADGKLLFVANAPANCLEIFRVRGTELTRISAVPVGMDPVAVAVRNQREVWVVNHMSDSVSIVDLQGTPRVKQTLLVGDEPRDIVFAGDSSQRAFITTAHRGQNHLGVDPQDFRTPSIGRADVWVYDAGNPGSGLSGEPLKILSLFTDVPRALTASPDGTKVYAAGFLSGNRTTVLMPQTVDQPKAGPHDSADGVEEPGTGLIVRFDGQHWVDELGQQWDDKVLFNLPDQDVFEIDATATPPVQTQAYSGVGTVLFNMAVNPTTGALYVSNTEALNDERFEGPGERGSSIRGRFVQNRITVVSDDGVVPHHLNSHVDFSLPEGEAIPVDDKERTLAQPMAMIFSPDGTALYVAAFGSGKVARIPTAALESGSYDPYDVRHIAVPGGPAGLALSRNGRYLFVYSRFDNQLSVVDTEDDQLISSQALYNPEPERVKGGRPFLYDAMATSSNGTVSCGSCHVFGDLDGLAWDLGNPDAVVVENPLEESPGSLAPLKSRTFHPLKGPMTTQTFRGISMSGPMHWRGDRTGIHREVVNGELESQEAAAFKEFDEAFVGLLGREAMLTHEDMQRFTDFSMGIQSPPNPIRGIDGSLTERQRQGREDYFEASLDRGVSSCNSCHELDKEKGLFGTDKKITSEGPLVSQDFKIPHLRNMYQKVGMFGTSYLSNEHMGDQIRGFGYGHDGTFASVDDFLLKLGGFVFEDTDQAFRISEFLMAFDAEHEPSVGQMVTLTPSNFKETGERASVLVEQAIAGACDLAIHGNIMGLPFSGTLDGQGRVASEWLPAVDETLFRHIATWPGHALTYSCLPAGTGNIYGYREAGQ